MRTLHLKLILLIRSIPTNDIELRELLKKGGLIERFTPYLGGAPDGRGPVRSSRSDLRDARRGDAKSRNRGMKFIPRPENTMAPVPIVTSAIVTPLAVAAASS